MASSCITTPVFQTFQQVIQVTLTKFTTTVTAQAAGITVFTEVCDFGCPPGVTELLLTETLPGNLATITVPIQAVVPSTVIRTSTQFITSCTLISGSNPTKVAVANANAPGQASSTQPGVLQVLASPTPNPASQGTGSGGLGGSSGLLGGGGGGGGGGAQQTISSGFGQPTLTGSAGSAAGSAAGSGAGSGGGSPGAGGISADVSIGSTAGGPLSTGTATVIAGSTSASHKGPIIGAVIALFLIIVTLAMLWYLIRRKRRSTQPIREVQRRSFASSMESTTPQMGEALPGYSNVRYDHLFPADPKNASMVHLDGTLYQQTGFWSDKNGSDWSLTLPAGMGTVLPEYGS